MAFEFKKCFADGMEIRGLYEVRPEIFGDRRGCFSETYSEREFFEAGLTMRFVQDNQSMSSKSVLRGLHFQTRHPQGKLVRTIFGKVYDVVVDLRKGSGTFGKHYGLILDDEKKKQFYIPEGFAHGFYVLSDSAVYEYKCTDFYDPEGEGGLLWNDPGIGIDWKSVAHGADVLLSEKDGKLPCFDKDADYFDLNGKWIGD